MKALISPDENNRVVEVVTDDFPVAEPLFWVDCPDSVTTEWTYDGANFSAPHVLTIGAIRLKVIDSIKNKRDQLIVSGGHKIGAHWYHSDQISLIQQLGLSSVAKELSAGGASDDTVIVPTPWKTLGGGFVNLTIGIAKQFVQSALTQQSALFNEAKSKIEIVGAIESDEDLLSFDVNANWPDVFVPGT